MAGIDVLMPVKNAATTVGAAIDSILQQSFRDLRLIVVDDGSADGTRAIAQGYADRDGRVTIARNPGRGIVSALNFGLENASAPFIARMDADDISLKSRLKTQFEFMQDRPNVAVVGSRFRFFGSRTGCPEIVLTAEDCREAMCLFSPVCHPSVLMRRDALERLTHVYSSEFPHAEDYELFSRLVSVGEVCNLAEPLLHYRVHAEQVSSAANLVQRRSAFQISARYVSEKYGIDRKATSKILAVMVKKAMRLGFKNARTSARALRNGIHVVMEKAP